MNLVATGVEDFTNGHIILSSSNMAQLVEGADVYSRAEGSIVLGSLQKTSIADTNYFHNPTAYHQQLESLTVGNHVDLQEASVSSSTRVASYGYAMRDKDVGVHTIYVLSIEFVVHDNYLVKGGTQCVGHSRCKRQSRNGLHLLGAAAENASSALHRGIGSCLVRQFINVTYNIVDTIMCWDFRFLGSILVKGGTGVVSVSMSFGTNSSSPVKNVDQAWCIFTRGFHPGVLSCGTWIQVSYSLICKHLLLELLDSTSYLNLILAYGASVLLNPFDHGIVAIYVLLDYIHGSITKGFRLPYFIQALANSEFPVKGLLQVYIVLGALNPWPREALHKLCSINYCKLWKLRPPCLSMSLGGLLYVCEDMNLHLPLYFNPKFGMLLHAGSGHQSLSLFQ